MATLWTLSIASSVVAVAGYLPEFRRLCVDRCRGGAGVGLWVLWTVSAMLSLANAVACEASPLVTTNCAVIVALTASTAALNAALVVLKPGGILTVVCYPGHPGGDEESAAVVAWCEGLEAAGIAATINRRTDTLRPSPFLVSVRRK